MAAYSCMAVAAGISLAAALLFLARYIDPPITAVQLQRCVGSLGASRSLCGRPHFVPLAAISPHLRTAVVEAEDARFFEHHGVDWSALRDAAEANYRRGYLWRGGSTITQQLVKNLFLTTRGGFARKVAEVPLALLADLLLSKSRQLEIYLNVVEWGPGIFGAERGAVHHFGIPANALTRRQSAQLAALLPSPLKRTPANTSRAAERILRRMP